MVAPRLPRSGIFWGVAMTEPRRLSDRELEDIIGYEADFTGATYKPTSTFLMAREIIALREGAKQGIAAANATSELNQRILAERDELRDQLRLANIDASKLREGFLALAEMVARAAEALRELADMDDDGSPRLMTIAGEAARTLKAMREIGGVDA